MPVEQHLEELRRRVLVSLLAFLVAAVALFPLSGAAFRRVQADLLAGPAGGRGVQVVATSLTDALAARVKLSALLALLVVAPTVGVYEAFAFVNPGLLPAERRLAFLVLPPMFAMLCAGAAFAYAVLLPVMISFLVGFTVDMGVTPLLSVDSMVTFVISTMLLMGLMFELPVACALLSRLGALPPSLLARYRRHLYLAILLVAGVVTPDPTVASQLVLAVPMVVLYEVGVLLARALWRGG